VSAAELVVFFVGAAGSPVPQVVSRTANQRRWRLEVLEAVPVSAGSGRKMKLLPRVTADHLYVQLHRSASAVIYQPGIEVRKDPSGGHRDDKVFSLFRFCNYKAFIRSTNANDIADWGADFERWCSNVGCEGKSDVRCLPFHMFDFEDVDRHDLNDPGARQAFGQARRKLVDGTRGWLDENRLLWAPATPGTLHGREPITVAGQPLEIGFHWDVRGRDRKLTSATTKWKVLGYTNVYPDGCVRRSSGSRQIWTIDQSVAADETDRQRAGLLDP
jgi:hypothetical protein